MKCQAMIILFGAFSFWGPVILINLITKQELSLAIGTLLPPTTHLLGYLLLRRRFRRSVRSISLWTLVGVYMFGTIFMFVGFMPTSGGFFQPLTWNEFKWLLVSLVFPPITFVFSAFHVTLFGLLCATLFMFINHFALERKPKSPDA